MNIFKNLFKKKAPTNSWEDGVDFQWGEKKYRTDEIDENGGKYWRKNLDGSVTEFNPPGLQLRIVAMMINERFLFKPLKDDYSVLRMMNEKEAIDAGKMVNCNNYYFSKGIRAAIDKNIIKITTSGIVLESKTSHN